MILKKKKIFHLIKSLFLLETKEDSYKIIFYKSVIDIKKKKILIIYGKKFFFILISIFFIAFLKKIPVQKNFFLIFNLNKTLIGNNLIPDWPGNYLKQNLFINLKMWFKIFSYIFLYKKKLYLIILKLN